MKEISGGNTETKTRYGSKQATSDHLDLQPTSSNSFCLNARFVIPLTKEN
jgi:hypothetical protein